MIEKMIAAAAVAATTLVAGAPAEARDCVMNQGYEICFQIKSVNGHFNRWEVVFTNAYTTEYMDVTCHGKSVNDWNSRGGLSQYEANRLATFFCSI